MRRRLQPPGHSTDTIRTVETFESYVNKRPVFQTFLDETKATGALSLRPLEMTDVAEGVALPDDIAQTEANRSRSIISVSTILKSDFFSNSQKMALPECVPLYIAEVFISDGGLVDVSRSGKFERGSPVGQSSGRDVLSDSGCRQGEGHDRRRHRHAANRRVR